MSVPVNIIVIRWHRHVLLRGDTWYLDMIEMCVTTVNTFSQVLHLSAFFEALDFSSYISHYFILILVSLELFATLQINILHTKQICHLIKYDTLE